MSKGGFLVLDTNIWVYSTQLLNTPMGAAVLYSLSQTNRKIALPNVIEDEIKKHTNKYGSQAIDEINKNYRLIEQLMGVRDDYRVPSKEQLLNRFDSRLIELSGLVHKIEFNMDHVKSALRRVNEESSPNGYKNQQFKDSLIWEIILELAKEVDVDFVTKDKAFFHESKPTNGLAKNLVEDCEDAMGEVRVFYDLPDYLSAIKEELPPFDNSKVIEKLDYSLKTELSQKATDKGYRIEDIADSSVLAFLTEKPMQVAVEFVIKYSASEVFNPDSGETIDAILIIEGNCGFDISTNVVSDVQIDLINMITKGGVNIPSYGNIIIRPGNATIGRSTVPYQIKKPIQ